MILDEFKEMLEERSREDLPSVLLVSSECAPLSKTGGLADVVGTLPKNLMELGVDARVITPYHHVIKEKYASQVEHMFMFYVQLGWRREYCGIEKLILDGVTIYLVDSEAYFGDRIYRGGSAEIEQYAFFQRAVLDAMPNLDFVPEIIHCNDWQAAMIPMLARTQYQGCMQESRKYLLSIHNIMYQGVWGFDYFQDLFGISPAYYTPEFIELKNAANMMKAGCVFADRLSTVSPTYANEIKTPYFAEGLEGILNARSAQLTGILNGIDTEVFNPNNDSLIPKGGKAKCKKALQKRLGLTEDSGVPIISMVSRMTEQKGFDLVMAVIDDMMLNENVQFVLLGTGDAKYELFMREFETRYKGRACCYIGYSEELSHLIYAGSDFFLMPSRFEPCGLSQMISMRYGTLPIVRETGGLKDSVIPYNCETNEGTGFSFANYDAWEMRGCIHYALQTYSDKAAMKILVSNAMQQDFSFERSAKEYVRLYISMLDGYHETLPGLIHNMADTEFRKPFGAVKNGEKCYLSFELLSGRMNSAQLVLKNDGQRIEYEMEPGENGYFAEFYAPEQCGAWEYIFRINTKYGDRFLCPDYSKLGSALKDYEDAGFPLTVYLKNFETPEWFKHGVMYQIFPDRFGFKSKTTVQKGIEYHKSIGQKPELHKKTSEEVKYKPRKGEKDYYPDDFYGGTLKGIQDKLGYLKDLGISCIYLNPIVEARSNHRYDTSDYMNVDPILGSVKDFETLCSKASELGIRIILDGVFSHTGADSIYFNRYGHYQSKGACWGEGSRFYPWYHFDSFPDKYKCWWDFEDLPEVDERNEDWQKYIITDDNSVIKTWLNRGAGGWRLDVADEIPDDVLTLMRMAVKEVNPDAPIIGEVWEDAVTKTGPEGRRNYALGFSLDSVMNYPLRWAVLDFLHFRKNAYDFAAFLILQQINYPKPLYDSLMNLLSSHDVDRIKTALATPIIIRGLDRDEQLKIEITDEDYERALKLERLAAVIQFSIPGVPCIYYGDEQGMIGLCDPFNRRPFAEDDTELHAFYRELANKRLSNDALNSGDARFVALNDDVIAIIRTKGKKTAVALINRGKIDYNYDVEGIASGVIKAETAVIEEY